MTAPATSERESLFVIDFTTNAIHRRECLMLLATRGHDLRPFEGLEHALMQQGLLWCGCALGFLTKAVAGVYAGIGKGGEPGNAWARHAAQLRMLGDVILRNADDWSRRHGATDPDGTRH